MIKDHDDGLAAAGRDVRARDPGFCAGAERGAARGDQVELPLRLHGALLEHPAGRRSLAGMPAEEHVEPVGVLRRRGAARWRHRPLHRRPRQSRSRTEGRAQSRDQDRACSAAAPSRARTAAEPAAKTQPRQPTTPGKPSQRADLRDQERTAAPTIPRSARACRPAARRRWNAWRRTRPRSRRPAPRPLPRRRWRCRSGSSAQRGDRERAVRPRCRRRACAAPCWCCARCGRANMLFVLRSACGARRAHALRRRARRRRPDHANASPRRRRRCRRPAGRAGPVRRNSA